MTESTEREALALLDDAREDVLRTNNRLPPRTRRLRY